MKNLRLSIDNSNYKLELDHNNFNQKLLNTLYVLYYQHNNIYFKNFDDINKLQETIDHSKFIIIFGHITNLTEYSHILNNILRASPPILNSLCKYFMIHINNNFGDMLLKNYIVSDKLIVNIHLPLSLYKKFDIRSEDSLVDDVKFNIINNVELPYTNISAKIFNKIDEYKKEITDIEYLDLELENLNNINKTKELLNILDINVELHDEFLNNNRNSIHNLLNKKQEIEKPTHQPTVNISIKDKLDELKKSITKNDLLLPIIDQEIEKPTHQPTVNISIKDKLDELTKSMTNPKLNKLNDSLLSVIDQKIEKPMDEFNISISIKDKLNSLLNKRKDYLKKYKNLKEINSNKTKLYNNEKLKGELKKIIEKHVNIKSIKFDESNINHMVYNILLNEYNSIKINKKIVESEIRNKNCNDIYNLLHDLKKYREKSYDSTIQNNIDDLNKYDKSLSVYNKEFIQTRDNIINIANQYIDDIHTKNTILQHEFKKDIEFSKEEIYSSIEEEQYNTGSILNKQKELTEKYNKEYSKNLHEINKNESYIKSSIDILSNNYKRLISKYNDKLAQKINNIKKNTERDIINRDLQDRIYQPIYDIISKSITIQTKKEEEYTMFDDVKHNLEKERDNVLNDFQDDFKILKESIQERKAEYEKIKNERKEIFRRKLEYKIDKYMNRNKLTTHKKNPNILYKKKTYKSVVLW